MQVRCELLADQTPFEGSSWQVGLRVERALCDLHSTTHLRNATPSASKNQGTPFQGSQGSGVGLVRKDHAQQPRVEIHLPHGPMGHMRQFQSGTAWTQSSKLQHNGSPAPRPEPAKATPPPHDLLSSPFCCLLRLSTAKVLAATYATSSDDGIPGLKGQKCCWHEVAAWKSAHLAFADHGSLAHYIPESLCKRMRARQTIREVPVHALQANRCPTSRL